MFARGAEGFGHWSFTALNRPFCLAKIRSFWRIYDIPSLVFTTQHTANQPYMQTSKNKPKKKSYFYSSIAL
jgi:hypothetical protein